MAGNQLSEGHSLSRDDRGRGKSGHRKKVTNQGTLTSWRQQREGQVRTQKKATDQGALTLWRWQREGQVRTWKESNQPRHTHQLEMAEGGTSQDTERKQPIKVYSPTGDGRGGDKSGHRKKATD